MPVWKTSERIIKYKVWLVFNWSNKTDWLFMAYCTDNLCKCSTKQTLIQYYFLTTSFLSCSQLFLLFWYGAWQLQKKASSTLEVWKCSIAKDLTGCKWSWELRWITSWISRGPRTWISKIGHPSTSIESLCIRLCIFSPCRFCTKNSWENHTGSLSAVVNKIKMKRSFFGGSSRLQLAQDIYLQFIYTPLPIQVR